MREVNFANELKLVALAMFRKSFIGIYHGSLSARIEHNRFLINKKDAIFDGLSDDDLIELCSKKDYRWNDASMDSDIHFNLYKNISEAKYICFAMPPFITSYALTHDLIVPRDYFGFMNYESVGVYDPKNFEDWYERADVEIPKYMKENKTNIMVIRGYGIYTYSRDIHQIAKNIAILENSCRILHLSKKHSNLIR